MCFDDFKLLLINVYLPFEDGNAWTDEYTSDLSIIEDLIGRHSYFNVILDGNVNAGFTKDRLVLTLLDKCCQENDIVPVLKHANCSVDYTCQI